MDLASFSLDDQQLPSEGDAGFECGTDLPDPGVVYRRLKDMEARGADGRQLLRAALTGPLAGQIATVSSFGAESAVLLSLVAGIDPATPVVFLDTGKHFPETLAYREELAEHLGLSAVLDVQPEPVALENADPTGELWHYDTDACCALRKVQPLSRALHPFAAWISGRKRYQAATRAALPFVEWDGGRIKLNPLADWDAARIEQEMGERGLPRHPLLARGFRSVGCSVCTRAVGQNEDSRAGRWSGSGKVECGIHRMKVPA
jgi:phosphoadenosine phosphosulfate reductase